MLNQSVLTKTEEKVIAKRLNYEKLTKQDSFYLSTSIRPKLEQMEELIKKNVLKRLKYNQKSKHIENKIKNLITEELQNVETIVLFGSVVQTNYSNYKDIDVVVTIKDKVWKNELEKIGIIRRIEDRAKSIDLNLDLQIIDSETFREIYFSNISLVYQLENRKVIYGKLKISKKMEISKLDLKMKMDWSEPGSDDASGSEIYDCIRNTVLVKLILNKIVDNFYLSSYLAEELGNFLITRLKDDSASGVEKKFALKYLNKINAEVSGKIDEGEWEKIVI